MKVTVLALVRNMCEIFVLNFEDSITNIPMNRFIHDKSWKESEEKLAKVIVEILDVLWVFYNKAYSIMQYYNIYIIIFF